MISNGGIPWQIKIQFDFEGLGTSTTRAIVKDTVTAFSKERISLFDSPMAPDSHVWSRSWWGLYAGQGFLYLTLKPDRSWAKHTWPPTFNLLILINARLLYWPTTRWPDRWGSITSLVWWILCVRVPVAMILRLILWRSPNPTLFLRFQEKMVS